MSRLVPRVLAGLLWLEALLVAVLCVVVLTGPSDPARETALALRLGAGALAVVVLGLLVAGGLVLWRRHRRPPGRAGVVVLVLVALLHFVEAASTIASALTFSGEAWSSLAGGFALSTVTLVVGVLVLWAGVARREDHPG